MAKTAERISTLLGAPNRWRSEERKQMKNIHTVWKQCRLCNSYQSEQYNSKEPCAEPSCKTLAGEDMKGPSESIANQRITAVHCFQQDELSKMNGNEQEDANRLTHLSRDTESYLPRDSILRTKDGRFQEPAYRPLSDMFSFEESCNFRYWEENFTKNNVRDQLLSSIARGIVSHICESQSARKLRSRHGRFPCGSFLRMKREHFVPLTLFLHEMKLWATNTLNKANGDERSTYEDIQGRIRYVNRMKDLQIWVKTAAPTRAGIRNDAHFQLFRLLLNIEEDLSRAKDYCYRKYSMRASREKLNHLGNLLKEVLLSEMRNLSAMFQPDKTLNVGSSSLACAALLEPLDFLSTYRNQSYIDYQNMANVCLYVFAKQPLVEASLLSNYDTHAALSQISKIEFWSQSNPFVNQVGNGFMDNLLPQVYRNTVQLITSKLKSIDPSIRTPHSVKVQTKLLKQTFQNEVTERFLRCIGALYELVPLCYVVHELWHIAGQGGDYSLYDSLRHQVIATMDHGIARIKRVQETEKDLFMYLSQTANRIKINLESKRLKKKRTLKAFRTPSWITHLHTLKQTTLPSTRTAFNESCRQMHEISDDAKEYSLTSDQLNERINNVKGVCKVLFGESTLKETCSLID